MFVSDKIEQQKMNSISHQSYSNMKKNIEWSGKLEVQSLKKITYRENNDTRIFSL